MRIRLIRKLANVIDGVDISDYAPGDVINLEPDEARLLMAEGWAVSARRSLRAEVRQSTTSRNVAVAADFNRQQAVEHLRRASRLIDGEQIELPHGRRREDVLLDELQDSRATTIRTTDE